MITKIKSVELIESVTSLDDPHEQTTRLTGTDERPLFLIQQTGFVTIEDRLIPLSNVREIRCFPPTPEQAELMATVLTAEKQAQEAFVAEVAATEKRKATIAEARKQPKKS